MILKNLKKNVFSFQFIIYLGGRDHMVVGLKTTYAISAYHR